jgi:DNA replication and repair protein RecF
MDGLRSLALAPMEANAHIAVMPLDAASAARSIGPERFSEPRSPFPLAIAWLSLTDFRCYQGLRLCVDERPVVLTGANGAGKTNILEAVSFLVPGRGLRRSRLSEVDRRPLNGDGAGGSWAVAAQLRGLQGEIRIGTGRDPGKDGQERRLVRIDGVPARSQTALAGHVAMVWLTPQMDRLFLEGSSARRRFLDRLVFGFDPGHASRAAAYEHSLRERAKLLREGCADRKWFLALEETLASHGVAIAAARREVVASLDLACRDGIGPFPRADLTAAGLVEEWLAEMPALAAEERLRERLAQSRARDAETGSTAIGPHRSDFAVRHGSTGAPAAQCSTGEQKALLIAILLAHMRLQCVQHGAAPLLLLDEVAAHLDGERREALYREILTLGAQAWLTGTEEAYFRPLDGVAQFFRIAEAQITPR